MTDREFIDDNLSDDDLLDKGLFDYNKAKAATVGIGSDCKTPSILFACKESYDIASQGNQQIFATKGCFAQIYFDFQSDSMMPTFQMMNTFRRLFEWTG